MRTSLRFHAMGSPWEVSFESDLDESARDNLSQRIGTLLDDFDKTYSRFKSTSLVRQLAEQTGKRAVPSELVEMLRLMGKVNKATDGMINPFVGQALEDLGYDETYSLQAKSQRRAVPDMDDVLTILDDTHIELRMPALIDLGGIGKGYAVQLIEELLSAQGVSECLVNGSGDLLHRGEKSVRVGLENPFDDSQAIGVVHLLNKSLASSGVNRRRWQQHHHIVHPTVDESPQDIVAVWVLADNPAEADILATALFLASPADLESRFEFDWLVIDQQRKTYKSKNFHADLF